MVNIDGIKGTDGQAQGQKTESVEPAEQHDKGKPTEQPTEHVGRGRDQVNLTGSVVTRKATYSRQELDVRAESADAARAERLKEIQHRVASGYYDSREVYEKVTEKLLAQWHIGLSRDD